jgi:hypothetical protein
MDVKDMVHTLSVEPTADMVRFLDALDSVKNLDTDPAAAVNATGSSFEATGALNSTSFNGDGGLAYVPELHCAVDVFVPVQTVMPAEYPAAASAHLKALNVTHDASSGPDAPPGTLHPPSVTIQADPSEPFLRIDQLYVDYPAANHSADVSLSHVSVDSIFVSAGDVARVDFDDVDARVDVTVVAPTVRGFLGAAVRGANNVHVVNDESAGGMALCQRAGRVVSASGSRLFPAVAPVAVGLLGAAATVRVSSSSPSGAAGFVVDATEGMCGSPDTAPMVESTFDTTSSTPFFDASSSASATTAIETLDLVNVKVRGFGATRGYWSFASSEAYSFFSAAFVSAFSLTLLAPTQNTRELDLAPGALCGADAGWIGGPGGATGSVANDLRIRTVARGLNEHVYTSKDYESTPKRVQVYHPPFPSAINGVVDLEVALVDNTLVIGNRAASLSAQLTLWLSTIAVVLVTVLTIWIWRTAGRWVYETWILDIAESYAQRRLPGTSKYDSLNKRRQNLFVHALLQRLSRFSLVHLE